MVRGLFLPLLLAGCLGNEPLLPIEQEQQELEGYLIDINGQPPFVVDVVLDASVVWRQHGLHFVFGNEGNIILHTAHYPTYCQYDRIGDIANIRIAEDVEAINLVCTIAQYLGYSVGLGNIEGKSLMNRASRVGEECYWSEQDEEELCRVLNLCQTD